MSTEERPGTAGKGTLHVEFYRSRIAFPHSRMHDRPDDIMVGVSPNGQHEGGNYEFSIEHVGTERGLRPIALRVQLFTDSWRAFADLPEFFALLASLDTSVGTRPGPTLDDLTPRLAALGWMDITDKYASRHEHVIGCLTCGERIRDLSPADGGTS